MSKIFRFTVLCSVLLLCAAMAFAASQNAVVYGTVYDASAKPLGGVKVTLENPAIAVNRSTMTAADGSYSFSEVAPASGYKVSASQNGTLIDARTDITVNVGEESVIFPALKASATPKPTESSAMNMPVSTEKVATAQSGVITGEQLRSLPLYNRNFLTLGTLTPHTHPSGAADPLGDASFSVAGNRSTGNAFLLDGADNRASSTNQAVPFQVNDAIQEFRVISSAANAEYGANGGTVNVVTKRGTNNWHGNAFGYFGADVLNSDGPLSIYNGGTFDQAAAYAGNPATTTVVPAFDPIGPTNYNDYVNSAEANGWCTDQISFFTGVAGPNSCAGPGWGIGGTGFNTRFDPSAIRASNDQFKTPWNSQQFGANIGGPLMKDKVFLFAGYEGTHLDNPNPIFERVPTAFDRTYDPYGFGVNFLQNDLNYTIAQNVLNLFPQANVVGVPGVLEFYQGEAPNHTMVHNGIGRVDWVYGPKDTFGLRWVAQWLNQLHDDTLPATGSYPGNGAYRDAFNQNINLSYTHVFSSTLLNEAHAGFNRFKLKETAQDGKFDATTLGFPNPTSGSSSSMMTFLLSGIDPQYSGQTPVSQGAIGGWSDSCFGGADGTAGCWSYAPGLDGLFPYARLGAPLYAPSKYEDWSWFATDSVSWTKGRHQFKFGAEYDHFLNGVFDGGLNRGMVYSGNIGQFVADSETCNLECGNSFFRPTFDYMQKNLSPWNIDLNSHNVAFFAEDTIRAYSRLTVNLGIRWEYFSAPLENHDQLWNFDPLANGLVQQGSTSVVNQAGNPCTGPGSITQFPFDIPAAAGFFPGDNLWDCQTSGRNGLDHTHWTNFMPRIGAAWDLFGDGKTVARFGVGMFYDREPITYTSQLMKNRPTIPFAPDSSANGIPLFTGVASQLPQAFYGGLENQFGFGNSNLNPAIMVGGFPFQFFGSAMQPGAMYGRDLNHDNNPRVWQINANIQHQFTRTFVAEAGYVGSYGGKLPTFYNQGFANEWFCNSSGFSGTCDNNSFSPVFMQTNQGESQYNSVYARARVAEWHGLRVNGTYTFSHARDNASSLVFPNLPVTLFGAGCGPQFWANNNPLSCSAAAFGAGAASTPSVMPLTTTGAGNVITTPYLIPQDSGNFLRDDWGRSDYNSDHRFVVDWTYDVPSLQKKWGWSKYADYWQLSGVTIVQSGQPYTIYSLIGGELSQRANASGPVATSTDPNNAISLTNLSTAFSSCGPAIPDAGVFFASDGSQGQACDGNTPRNAFNGPMYSTFNMSIQKGFPIGGEGRMLTVRSEFYNLFGADNFYNPVSLLSTNGFTVNPDFGKIKSAHDPRQIQFAVRYSW